MPIKKRLIKRIEKNDFFYFNIILALNSIFTKVAISYEFKLLNTLKKMRNRNSLFFFSFF